MNERQKKEAKQNKPKHRERIKLKFLGLTKVIKERKGPFVVYMVLRALVILALIFSCVRGHYESAFYCILSLILFLIPSFLTANFGIEFPSTMEIIVLLFIFCAEILGEVQCYYLKYPYWDTILHTTNGFLCAACGFGMVDILNKNPKIKFKMSPFFLSMVAFCFSMTIGVLWEFFEFSSDMILHTDTQKDTIVSSIYSVDLNPSGDNIPVAIENISDVTVNGQSLGLGGYLDIGLMDTMGDLFVNFMGAIVFSIIGFFYFRSRCRNKNRKNGKNQEFAERFIPTLAKEFQLSSGDSDNEAISDVIQEDIPDTGADTDVKDSDTTEVPSQTQST